MKRIIRLTESELIKTIKRIVNESEITELGQSNFSDIEDLDCVRPKGDLRAGISTLSNENIPNIKYLVVYYVDVRTDKKVVYGYGPQVSEKMYNLMVNGNNPVICKIAKKMLNDMYSEYEEDMLNN